MKPRTHRAIEPRWSGHPTQLSPGQAVVELETTSEMAADAEGLVHGGFLFSLADYAAMLAVNDPLVVLSRASVEFLRPVAVGEIVTAHAERLPAVEEGDSRRPRIHCELRTGDAVVFRGDFDTVIPRRHVLAHRDQTTSGGGE